MRFVYNTSPSPVVVDAHGHTVAGQDWRQVDETAPEVTHALHLGLLVWRDQPPQQGDDPNAVAAFNDQPAAPSAPSSEEPAK